MEECQDVEEETIQLVREFYPLLQLINLDGKSSAQRLEVALSTAILKAEELILYSKIKFNTDLEIAYRRRRAILKRLADGLAWKFFGFDEHLLRVYAQPDPPGFMAGKSGYSSERLVTEVGYEYPEVKFAIQNDITNVLRVGDVTLLLSNGAIFSIEVKASHRKINSPRTKRQIKRYEEIVAYVQAGSGEMVEILGEPQYSVAVPLDQKYYWKDLERIAFRAKQKGAAWQVVDKGVLIICHKEYDELKLQCLLGRALHDARWIEASVRFGCLSRHADPLDNDILRYVTPITAFELDPSILVDLLVGGLDATILVDVNVVKQMFRATGFETEISIESRMLIKASSGTKLKIAERPWNLLVYGLLTLPCFITLVASSLAEAEKRFKT